MNLAALIAYLLSSGSLGEVVNNPVAQFGTDAEPLIGARFLPEVTRTSNEYRERDIRFVTVVAPHASRFSPVQARDGQSVSSMLVTLGESDIGADFEGEHYDALLEYLQQLNDGAMPSMEQLVTLLNWVDVRVVRALKVRNEVDRWKAMVTGEVPIKGDGGYEDLVVYEKPAGHRVAAGGAWSNVNYAIYDDITTMVSLLRGKGYQIGAIVCGESVIQKMLRNKDLQTRAGGSRISINATGQLLGQPASLMTRAELGAIFADDNLPPITEYNGLFRRPSTIGGWTTDFYVPRDAMVFLGLTGREAFYRDANNVATVITDVLGYTGIGRPAGQTTPGARVVLQAFEDKPPRVNAQGWQTSLPVIQDPEAIAVITGIA